MGDNVPSDHPPSVLPASGQTSIEPSSKPSFQHTPVMCDEIVDLLESVPAGVYLDATLGGAGHASAVLAAHSDLDLLGIDQDPIALQAATKQLSGLDGRVRLVRSRFDQLDSVLSELEVTEISAFLFDLGVSSPQLDRSERGFSFRNDGPLDMRMDPDSPLTADIIVNTFGHGEIAAILKQNGDERFAGRIASAILKARPLSTTAELAEVIVQAIPAAARRKGGHPAKRSFQALRIHVNSELQILRPAIEAAIDALCVGGRGLVLTYHSGEDKIVKDIFRGRSTVNTPPGLPVPAADPEFTLLRPLGRRPTEHEVAVNRRAASARLRVIDRNSIGAAA